MSDNVTICDHCGDEVEIGAECVPDETGHCIHCGQKIAQEEGE